MTIMISVLSLVIALTGFAICKALHTIADAIYYVRK